MPSRERQPSETARQVMPLALLCMGLIATNNSVTFLDSEASSLEAAAQPVRTLFAAFLSGSGQHEISPIFGILLHFWLRLTSWGFEYLRVPAIVFFLAGLFLLGRAARQFGGIPSATATIWLSILWPFGFHYGRLEAPYSFLFFLVTGLTFAYLKFLQTNSFAGEVALSLFGAALVWTDFFGWAVLACLAVDQLLHYFAKERVIPVRVMIRIAAFWMITSVAIVRPSYRGFLADSHFHQGFKVMITSFAVHVYTLFVSESVAPWRWQLSVPAGLAVLVCIVLVSLLGRGPSRRFLIYSAVLLLLMAITGTPDSGRLFLVAPWVLMPVAVAIESIQSRWARPALAASFLLIGAVGWYGIYAKRYYSNPQFLETWLKVAGDAADKIHGGTAVISNSRPFFLYLTYALRTPESAAEPRFQGLLPESVHQPSVFSAGQWLSSGHPMSPDMLWVHGASDPQAEEQIEAAVRELDTSCGSRESRLMMRDAGYDWKLRFLPQSAGPQWRIEVRDYDCAPNNSRENAPAPPY